MIVTYIRSSLLGSYAMCPHQAFMQYTLGIKTPSGLAAEKGNVIHKVMEGLAHLKKAQQDGKSEFESEGLGTVKVEDAEPSRLLVLAYEYYKGMSQNIWTEKDWKECVKWLNICLESNNGAFDPRKCDIIEPEKRFDITIPDDWAAYEYYLPNGEHIKGQLSIKGTIDLLIDVGDNTIEIVDYKTGQRKDWATGEKKDFKKLCKDQQLLLYFYACSLLYPDKDILVTIFYVRDGGPFTIAMDKEHRDAAEFMLKNRFKEMNRVLIPRRDIDFKCKRWCFFGTNSYPGTSQTYCDHIHHEILRKGIGQVTQDHTDLNKVDQYSDGGGRLAK